MFKYSVLMRVLRSKPLSSGSPREYKLNADDNIYCANDCVHALKIPSNKPYVHYLATDVSSNRPALNPGRRGDSSKEKRTHGDH
jgi:hypothetical protein